MKDVDRFVEDLTGANLRNHDVKTSDTLNHAAIAGIRDPENTPSASHIEDIQRLSENLKPFVDAQKGETTEELQKWRRDKFDA